ncbi:MAG: pitrilysin family protein [Bacteroidota bacterium]
MSDFQIHTLPNGLRIAYKQAFNTAVTHLGYTIYAGARDDGHLPGTAHCFEHMLFKGTKKRNALNIINRLEVVGGEMNAFTSKELTVLYASVVSEYTERALDLLTDLTFFSTFPVKELEKEKKVITEEINMYLDTPEENIYDEFQEMLFKGHSLAPNILGNVESLNKITSTHLKKFHKDYYHPKNVVLSISSNLPFSKIITWAEKYSEGINLRKYNVLERTVFKKYVPKHQTKETEHVQCHAILGNICYKHSSKERFPMMLLNNLLGGPGMNSRLTLAIREKHGYTYNVESGYTPFSDTGLFHCYLSTDKKYLEKSVALVYKELQKLKDKKLSTLQLHQAKTQLKGQIILAEESRLNLMLLMGKSIAQGQHLETLQEVIDKLDAIKAEEILTIANSVFNFDKMSYLAYIS